MIGEPITISVFFDESDRSIKPHPKFLKALEGNAQAKIVYESLNPSLQKEIVRYISLLKTEKSVDLNVIRAIDFLLGRGKFIGRERI